MPATPSAVASASAPPRTCGLLDRRQRDGDRSSDRHELRTSRERIEHDALGRALVPPACFLGNDGTPRPPRGSSPRSASQPSSSSCCSPSHGGSVPPTRWLATPRPSLPQWHDLVRHVERLLPLPPSASWWRISSLPSARRASTCRPCWELPKPMTVFTRMSDGCRNGLAFTIARHARCRAVGHASTCQLTPRALRRRRCTLGRAAVDRISLSGVEADHLPDLEVPGELATRATPSIRSPSPGEVV